MKPYTPKTKVSLSQNRLLTLIAVLGLAACGAGVARANDLINGNLDATSISSQNLPTPTGWTVDEFRTLSGPTFDGASSEGFANVLDPGGSGLFFKPFQGTPGDPLTVLFYQDVATAPGTKFTLSGFAAAEPNYSGFFSTNSPAPATMFSVVFLNSGGTVLASNVFDLVANGLPSGGPGSMTQFTTPQYTAPPNTATVRAGASIFNTYSTSGGQSFFVDAFDLVSEAPAGSPVISSQPAHKTVSAGANATFTVGVSNPAGVTYQWQFFGTNIDNGGNISGATSPTLTITGVTASNVGHYRVRVTNGIGTVVSADATLQIVGINFFPVISIEGKLGDKNVVEYSTALAPTTWIPLSTNILTTSPQLVIDSTSPGANTRFYRVVFQQP